MHKKLFIALGVALYAVVVVSTLVESGTASPVERAVAGQPDSAQPEQSLAPLLALVVIHTADGPLSYVGRVNVLRVASPLVEVDITGEGDPLFRNGFDGQACAVGGAQ